MESFTIHTGTIAVLDRENIDTDQIISKEFLKSIKRTGFGDALFAHWRFKEDGTPEAGFELNNPAFANASLLVSGNNFGCGSSREHAVWAIRQFGFRAVIAPRKVNGAETIPGFADIFQNNCFKNGVLPIELSQEQTAEIIATINSHKGIKATVDLKAQNIILHLQTGEKKYVFDIPAGLKTKLIEGLDEIGQTEKFDSAISAYERKHNAQMHA